MPALGWERAYRSGDLVRYDGDGLVFVGRADDQIKLGRPPDRARRDRQRAAPAPRGARRGRRRAPDGRGQPAPGRLRQVDDELRPGRGGRTRSGESMPAALVPRLAVVDDLPTTHLGQGRPRRPALAAARCRADSRASTTTSPGTERWIADLWLDVIGADVRDRGDDFFDLGGGSLTAAQIVSRLRTQFPEATVADLYEHPTVATLAAALDGMATPAARTTRRVRPTPTKTQVGQLAFTLPLRTISGLRWLTWMAAGNNLASVVLGLTFLPTVSWWWVLVGWLLLVSPLGRMALSAVGARVLLRRVAPGDLPARRPGPPAAVARRAARGRAAAPPTSPGAPWMPHVRAALGAKVGQRRRPALGPAGHRHAHAGRRLLGRAGGRPHRPLARRRRAAHRRGQGRRRRAGRHAQHPRPGRRRRPRTPRSRPGRPSSVAVPRGEFWSGSPAERVGRGTRPVVHRAARRRTPRWARRRTPRRRVVLSLLPLVAVLAGLLVVLPAVRTSTGLGDALPSTPCRCCPLAVVVALVVAGGCWSWLVVRARRSRAASPATTRCTAGARLAGVGDPAGPRRGPHLALPALRQHAHALVAARARRAGRQRRRGVDGAADPAARPSINDQAFLADDTLIGSYELGGGWLRVERVKIGKRAFVGNSGMAAAGRKVPKQSLVAVLSAAPRRKKAKAGSSWLGSPPTRLRRAERRRRTPAAPTTRPRGSSAPARRSSSAGCVPVMLTAAPRGRLIAALEVVADRSGCAVAAVVSGVVLMVGGLVAAALTTAAKWLLVGRHRGDRPPAVELVRLAQRAGRHLRRGGGRAVVRARRRPAPPALNVWLRSMGTKVGRGVWCETYWLPEPDLVELRDGATVNPGCVVQTHLFHDRVLSMDRVVLRARLDPRPEQRDPARRHDRPARYGWPGVPGDEG